MSRIIYLSILMMLVTAPSRMLPPFFLAGKKPPRFIASVLGYMPYAVIGSLIFPDSLYSAATFWSSAAGTLVAFAAGWYSGNILIVMSSSIAAAFLAAHLGF